MTICKGCGQVILWIKLKSGKAHPCNPLPTYAEDPNGAETIVTMDGRIAKGKLTHILKPDNKVQYRGYISHFATCPKAGQFRNK